ncbi:DUF397 domain-containing protein [Streptomyces arenae]|nr:DUF397 domain-containing protein [Streptomyces arenae]
MAPRRPIHWFKSSYSGGSGTECIEVAVVGRRVLIRDSKCPAEGRVGLGVDAWDGFIKTLQEIPLP